MKAAVRTTYPDAKAGAVPVWAGVLLRFAFEMAPGDLVISPHKPDSTINIGRIAGGYRHDAAAARNRNRRPVEWLLTGLPRGQFSKDALYEIGSAVTLFRVKNHAAEWEAAIDAAAHGQAPSGVTSPPAELSVEEAAESAEDQPSAARIEQYTRDFVLERLHTQLTGHEFEHFVAALLRAAGYRAQVTSVSSDGGFDIVVHRDPLGLEEPIIKVQCKRTVDTMSTPTVQKLVGTLAADELGLFVTLGTYARESRSIERSRRNLKLIDGDELVSLIFEHHDRLDAKWRRLLPLRAVYVVAPEWDGE